MATKKTAKMPMKPARMPMKPMKPMMKGMTNAEHKRMMGKGKK